MAPTMTSNIKHVQGSAQSQPAVCKRIEQEKCEFITALLLLLFCLHFVQPAIAIW